MSYQVTPFADLNVLVTHFRNTLINKKKFILLFAHNGIGKTRLSMAFKDVGKAAELPDTLYFNAFTEDLFTWDNDLDNDAQRILRINRESRFFDGLQQLDMENRIRPLLHRYTDFDFFIDYEDWTVNFSREVLVEGTLKTISHIKVSRGEENIFIWCFFLAIAQLAIDDDDQGAYNWVKYIYIDDPISSLDDNNAIAVASHLGQLLKNPGNNKKVIVSSHHALFFNVMWNELSVERGKFEPFFLSKSPISGEYKLQNCHDTPFFHHVALLKELCKAADSGRLYTYHFNILRSILEKSAAFHGFKYFSSCIKQDEDDIDGIVHARIVNVLSHGNYSLFDPVEMLEENKQYFKKILRDFMENYKFNPQLFSEQSTEATQS